MKFRQNNPSKKKTVIVSTVVIVLLLLTSVAVYAENNDLINIFPDKKNTTDTENAIKNDPTSGSKEDTTTIEGVDTSKSPDDIPLSQNFSITVSSLVQKTDTIDVDLKITNAASTGLCTLTFTKDGAKPVTRSIETNSEVCRDNIPAQEFEMTGLWKAEIRYFASSKQATTTSEITIQ